MNKTCILQIAKSSAWLSKVLRRAPGKLLKIGSALLILVSASASAQQSTGMNSASTMWGTSSSAASSGFGLDSALMNAANSNIAASAQSAKDGILYAPGTSITIQSIGAQNIVSNTINGSSNSVKIDSSQSSSNKADVTNEGTVNQIKP